MTLFQANAEASQSGTGVPRANTTSSLVNTVPSQGKQGPLVVHKGSVQSDIGAPHGNTVPYQPDEMPTYAEKGALLDRDRVLSSQNRVW